MCPSLFGWKSCKWLTALEVGTSARLGFWERLGCHTRGRVAYNERWAPEAGAVWTLLIRMLNVYYYVIPEAAVVRLMQGSATVLGCVATACGFARNDGRRRDGAFSEKDA